MISPNQAKRKKKERKTKDVSAFHAHFFKNSLYRIFKNLFQFFKVSFLLFFFNIFFLFQFLFFDTFFKYQETMKIHKKKKKKERWAKIHLQKFCVVHRFSTKENDIYYLLKVSWDIFSPFFLFFFWLHINCSSSECNVD